MFYLNIKKSIVIWILFISLASIMPVLTACKAPVSALSSPSPSISSPSSQTETSQIMFKTLSELEKIESCQLETNLVDTDEFHSQSQQVGSVCKWTSQRLINFSTKEMQETMRIDTSDSSGNSDYIDLEAYILKDEVYQNSYNPHTSGNMAFKSRLTDDMWNSDSRIYYLIELLKTATSANLEENQILNGTDCYVLDVNLSPVSVAEWLVSQEVKPGPSLTISSMPSIVGKEAYVKYNKQSLLTIWIAKNNNLPAQANIDALFKATSEELGANNFPGGNTNPYDMTVNIHGDMAFSNCNQPVSVQLPQWALNISDRLTPNPVPSIAVHSWDIIRPGKYAPAVGATDVPINPEFQWPEIEGAVSYDLQLADNPAYTDFIESLTGLNVTTWVETRPLEPGKTYYWRIREVVANSRVSDWVEGSFTTVQNVMATPTSTMK